jgi:hypothetical protein
MVFTAIASGPAISQTADDPDVFLWAGKPIAEYTTDSWKWLREIYDPIIAKYPTLADCPKDTTPSGQTTLNWSEYRELEEVEVCLFYLIDRIPTLTSVRSWALDQGFVDWFEPPELVAGAHWVSVFWADRLRGELLPNHNQWLSFDRGDRTYELWMHYDDEQGLRSLRFKRGPANYW